MGSTIMRLGTAHLARGQGRGACEALASPLTMSEMGNNITLWFVNTVVFASHSSLQLSFITHV